MCHSYIRMIVVHIPYSAVLRPARRLHAVCLQGRAEMGRIFVCWLQPPFVVYSHVIYLLTVGQYRHSRYFRRTWCRANCSQQYGGGKENYRWNWHCSLFSLHSLPPQYTQASAWCCSLQPKASSPYRSLDWAGWLGVSDFMAHTHTLALLSRNHDRLQSGRLMLMLNLLYCINCGLYTISLP